MESLRLPAPEDEEFLKIKGVRHYLWRAVDQNGAIDTLVQPKRDGIAAERLFVKLLRWAGREPRVTVTNNFGATVLPSDSCSPMTFTGRAVI